MSIDTPIGWHLPLTSSPLALSGLGVDILYQKPRLVSKRDYDGLEAWESFVKLPHDATLTTNTFAYKHVFYIHSSPMMLSIQDCQCHNH